MGQNMTDAAFDSAAGGPEVKDASNGQLRVPCEPMEALRINDACRAGAGGDLWTADQVGAAMPRAYAFRAPTFAPQRWAAAKPISQSAYTTRFEADHPAVVGCLLPLGNVVVAGYTAATCMTEAPPGSDLDLFIVGIDPEDRPALWAKVAEITAALRTIGALAEYAQTVLDILTPGAIDIVSNNGRVRIMLRAYPTLSALLHGFDTPADAVAFDGTTTVMTSLAANAHIFRANIVNPAYHSTMYAASLARWFKQNEYALVMPHLRPDAMVRGVVLTMPHLTITPTVVRGLFATGTVVPTDPNPVWDDFVERRDPRTLYLNGACPCGDPARDVHTRMNLIAFVSGGARYLMPRQVTVGGRDRWGGAVEDSKQDGHAYAEYAVTEPAFNDIFPPDLFRAAVDAAAADAISKIGGLNLTMLTEVFRFTPDEIGHAIVTITEASRARPGSLVDAAPILAKAKAALIAKYETAVPAIAWWVRPTHTAVAREPWPATAAEWYGPDQATDDPVCSMTLTLDSVLGHIEVSRTGPAVHDGECSLCHEALFRGATNSLLLECGHIFHWSGADCPGFLGWVAGGHRDCPVCRRDFADPRAASSPAINEDQSWMPRLLLNTPHRMDNMPAINRFIQMPTSPVQPMDATAWPFVN